LDWDPELCEILGIPIESLPQVKKNADDPFGYLEKEGIRIPIRGVLGDQQAALFGQAAFSAGEIKCTYGTGNFILLNIGKEVKLSQKGLLTTVAWQTANQVVYALEGSVFVTGAALRWLRDGLNIIPSFDQIDSIAAAQKDANGVIFVPAFVGLGAPYWDSTATGMMIGITGGTNKANILHATLDAIAYQTEELVSLMKTETGLDILDLQVDGGTTKSDVLMQKQADISQIIINRPINIETTALGAAYMAGIGIIWDNLEEIRKLNPVDREYKPIMEKNKSLDSIKIWKKAIERSIKWK
jgi:glycerol kinase